MEWEEGGRKKKGGKEVYKIGSERRMIYASASGGNVWL